MDCMQHEVTLSAPIAHKEQARPQTVAAEKIATLTGTGGGSGAATVHAAKQLPILHKASRQIQWIENGRIQHFLGLAGLVVHHHTRLHIAWNKDSTETFIASIGFRDNARSVVSPPHRSACCLCFVCLVSAHSAAI